MKLTVCARPAIIVDLCDREFIDMHGDRTRHGSPRRRRQVADHNPSSRQATKTLETDCAEGMLD